MRVLIYEPQFAGHNLAHVARLVRGVSELDCEIVLATSTQALASEEFALHLGDQRHAFDVLELPGFKTDKLGRRLKTNGLGKLTKVYQSFKRSIQRSKPDHVYLPHGNLLARFGWLPLGLTKTLRQHGAEAETLLITGRYLLPAKTSLEKLRQKLVLSMIARGPWHSVFQFNDAAQAEFERHSHQMARMGKLMPDPCGEILPAKRGEARHELGLPVEGRTVAVVGLIEMRKGVAVLANAMEDAAGRLRSEDRLLLMGSFHPEVHELLRTEFQPLLDSGRIVTIDRRLSSREFDLAIRAADVLATVYPSHPYTASMVVAGAVAQTPLLGSDNGWIGRMIRQLHLGHVCDASNPSDVAHQLLDSLDNCEKHQNSPAGMRFAEYCSDANHVAHWTARLRERLGLPSSPQLRSWEWVRQGTTSRAA